MKSSGRLILTLLGAAVVLAIVAPAFASGLIPDDPSQYRGAPGPLLGAGLPVLALAAGGYFLIKRLRGKAD